MPDPNTNNTQQDPVQSPPTITSPFMDIPAMPDDVASSSQNTSQPSDSGSSAPSVSFPELKVEEPKKKFGGGKGKIIATILGIVMLVGGVGTGVYLSLNNQNPNEKAAVACSDNSDCDTNQYCGSDHLCHTRTSTPAPTSKPPSIGPCKTCSGTSCVARVSGCDPGQNECESNFDCKPATTPTCDSFGTGLDCRSTSIPGGNTCLNGSTIQYCCPSGMKVINGVCGYTTPVPPPTACSLVAGQGCTSFACGSSQIPNSGPGVGYCPDSPSMDPANKYCCKTLNTYGLPLCTVAGDMAISSTAGAIHCLMAGTTNQRYQCPVDKPYYLSGLNECVVKPVTGNSCGTARAQSQGSNTNANSVTITQAMVDACTKACGDATLYASKFTCSGANLPGGCNTNGVIQNGLSVGTTVSLPNPTCGSIQIDIGCKNAYNTYGAVYFVSKSAATSCGTPTSPPSNPTPTPKPTPSPSPVPVAQCQNITAYSTTWSVLTATQLSALKAGSVVNFCVVGSATAGSFDKAMFNINGTAQAETTLHRPNTQDFCQQYTIPTGVYSFKITAQIHHVTLGWK